MERMTGTGLAQVIRSRQAISRTQFGPPGLKNPAGAGLRAREGASKCVKGP